MRTARAAGVVARQRVVEEHHQPVAGEPLERPLEAEDEVAERRVVLAQHRHDLLGLAGLGEGGEAAQVAEHHDDLAPVALEERLVAGVDDQVGQLRRQEAAQPAHPLELGRPASRPAASSSRFQPASSAAWRSIVSW